jgi:SsrA-binding protein
MAKGKPSPGPRGVRITNRKARRDYRILEVVEAGLELRGTEVKSLRAGQAQLDDSYARLIGRDLYLVGANIPIYPQAAGTLQHEPTRHRKLLLHRRQIELIDAHVRQKGKTVVPLAIYFHRGWAKCELGIVIGKRDFDKRETIRNRDQQRDIAREMRRRNR